MLETLNTGTMVTGTGLILSPSTTTANGVKKVKNQETKEEEWDISGFKLGTGLTVATTTTAAPTIQEEEYQRVINNAHSQISIVECASQEELEKGLEDLDRLIELSAMFEDEATSNIGEYGDAKKPYTK